METWATKIDESIAVAILPKNASTAIKSTNIFTNVCSTEYLWHNKHNYATRVAFIRHPHSRLVSAYQRFKALQGTNLARRFNLDDHHVDSWHSFVDHIMVEEDVHWASQTKLLTYKDEYVPNMTFRFEKLGAVMKHYFPDYPIEVVNKSTPQLTDSYKYMEIMEKYINDYYLWLLVGDENA